jgi:hypothetical protein
MMYSEEAMSQAVADSGVGQYAGNESGISEIDMNPLSFILTDTLV